MSVESGDVVYAEGYGRVTVGDVPEFDNLIEIVLPNGDTAWTHEGLVHPLDN